MTFISYVKTCQRLESDADSNNGFKTKTLLNVLAINWKKIIFTQHIKVKSSGYNTRLNSERQGFNPLQSTIMQSHKEVTVKDRW